MTAVKHVLLAGDFAVINGGQAKVAIDSARLLADCGIKVTFFAAVGPASDLLDHPLIEVICLEQADILQDPNRLRAMWRGIWNGRAAERLEEVAKRLDPATSVLHCHGYAKALSPAIGPVLARRILPTVYTMHEYFFACPNGGFYDFQSNEICTRRALGPACLTTHCDVRKRSHKAWRVVRQAVTWGPGRLPRGLDDIIYISDLQREVIEPYLPKSARLHHIPNPVPTLDLQMVEAEKNNVMLFVGRLNPEKGGLMFARAAKMAGIRAVFVGDGAERDQIEAENPEAEILGWKTPVEVQKWIGHARALVFPSLWYEGQPLVPMEALMRGVPVVCGSWSAARECVSDGHNGCIYHEPTPEALATALQAVKTLPAFDPAEIQTHVSPEKHLGSLITLYSKMLERRGH